jgi:hypothetical protein
VPRAALAAALAASLTFVAPLTAQGVCDGRPIRAIVIDARTVFSDDDSLIPHFVRLIGNDLHWQTRVATVRLDLLFAEGEPCDPRRLSETERLLRARPYIRSATVEATPTDDGGVLVTVRVRDEFSLEVRATVQNGGEVPLRRFVVTEDDVLGRGIHAQAYYNSFGRRSAVDGDLQDHHFLDRPLESELTLGKSEVGPVGEESLLRAFESDFDQVAWRESALYRKEPFPLVSTVLGTVLQPTVRAGADVGVARRFGVPGQLQVVGLVLSYDRALAEGAPLAPIAALDSAAAAQLAGRFQERRRIRLHLLVGARKLAFHAHRGVDAVSGIEDVPEGVQAGLVLGKSLFGGGGLDHDWFSAMELTTGTDVGGRLLVFTHGKVEGRYLESAGKWDGILADGEVLVYDIGPRSTTVLAADAAGGWDTRTPFQLLMAGNDGLRGYGSSALPVGRRIVLRAEERYFFGTAFGFADVGGAAFAETGRGWAGDAAFGESTGMLGTVGVGLRVAVPHGSRRVWRLDLAMPLSRGLGPELQLSIGQQFGIFHGEPQDVVRSRERISSVTVFDFPRF